MFENHPLISISREVMGGTPVFIGTRVPVQTLFDYLKAGESIDDFLDGFPTVTREQAIALCRDVAMQRLYNIMKALNKNSDARVQNIN